MLKSDLMLHEQTYTHDGKDSVEPTRIKIKFIVINPLNDELNHICHLLILLGDLTFMGPCIVSIF